MGLDLGHVVIHRDREADEFARAVDAEAVTSGVHVFFREGRYDPHSTPGLRLLAHEATHTVQQSRGAVSGLQHFGGLQIDEPGDSHEQEAERNADAAIARIAERPAAKGEPEPAVKRTPGRTSGSRYGSVIQRVQQQDKAPGFAATWTPSASVNSAPFFQKTDFDVDPFHDEFNVPPKATGRLNLLADVEWNRGGGGAGRWRRRRGQSALPWTRWDPDPARRRQGLRPV
jgi:hypothetical protein